MLNDVLLVSCPGEVGGTFLINEHGSVTLSNKASTGLFVDENRVIIADQVDDGKNLTVYTHDSIKSFELNRERLDLHDVFVVDDLLYAVATEKNCVLSFNQNFDKVGLWGLPGENDSAHMNSVVLYDGRLLASIFGRFSKNREYKSGTLGLGEVIDVKSGKSYITGLSQPHSLTVVGDLLYLCSSEERKVKVYKKNKLVNEIELPGYVRGLAVTKDYIYVGVSLSRNVKADNGEFDSATVITIDKTSLQVKCKYSLPCAEIYDIRIVNKNTDLYKNLTNEGKHLASFLKLKTEHEQLKFENEQLKSENEQLKSEHIKFQNMFNIVLGSNSWKLTKPLRYVRRIFNSIVGKNKI